ncbi:MAG TPA: AAA family ATPase [Nitrososphaeraceae archaeon]|nr:AAA family ATPase [Nitrososphaeraceae archaeon]
MNNFLRQSLTGLWKEVLRVNKPLRFEEIVGHDDIKQIFAKAILCKRPVHILLVGSPGSAKTMFLTEIMRHYKASYFVVGSNTTKAGLVNQLFERRPKILLIDELEKMNTRDQTSLLHLMETGIISETKINKTRQMQLTSWVFATANSCDKIIQPLLSRFAILEIAEYTFEEFTGIALTRPARENIDKPIALSIAEKVWHELDSKDIRDVIKVGRLASSSEEVSFVVKMLKKRISKSQYSACGNE